MFTIATEAQNKLPKGMNARAGSTTWRSESETCNFSWDSITGTLTITATSTNNEENITILLKSEGQVYTKGFTVGEYYFQRKSTYWNNYSLNAIYTKKSDNTIVQWQDNDDDEVSPGMVQITEITATNIKGNFYFDLFRKKTYSLDKSDVVSFTDGTFNIDLSNGKPTENRPSIVGIYDIQIAPGINWMKPKSGLDISGEFGTNYSLGFTVINLAHGKNSGSSSTISMHYDYSRQNAEAALLGSWHFRRNELFARIKPFTHNPVYSTYDNRFLGVIIAGLYADIGYTNGTYYYSNYLDEKQAPDYSQNGLVWGWGYNLIHRPEDKRWGMTVGYGAKIYSWNKTNGDRAKYASRTIWVGATYNLVWEED